MTIDSKYLPRTYEISVGDTEYYFEHESIGGETVKPLLQYTEADGYIWYESLGGTYGTTYGGIEPIYARGKFNFLTGQEVDYGELTNAKVYIQRKTEITQLLDLIPYTPFPAEDFEFGIDKLTLILQEIDGEACSCPWGGTSDAPSPPPDPPDPNYSCSSYADYLALISGDVTALTYTTSTSEPLSYPFSSTGTDDKFRYIFNWVSDPTLQPDYSGTNPSTSVLTISTADLSSMVGPDFCGGVTTRMLCINSGTTTGSDSIRYPVDADDWGNHNVKALVTGFNGGSNISGTLVQNTAKKWHYLFNGNNGATSGSTVEPGTFVTLSTSGTDLTLTIYWDSSGPIPPPDPVSMTVPGVTDSVVSLTAFISSGEPYMMINPSQPGQWILVRNLSIEASCNGQVLQHSGVQSYNIGTVNATPDLRDVYPVSLLYTEAPRILTNVNLSLLSLSAGLDGGTDIAINTQTAFVNNFI